MQKLNRRSLLLVGFTLFSMFFGAGNLIFPPYLGAQAGADAWLAFVGFAVSAIGLPVIGVVAVARAGGLSELAGRVHPRFAQIFALLVYLSIGPCLAIPRTASTSFQMLAPLIGGDAMRQLIYSIVFFAAAFFVALHPEKLTSWLGRILCPTLIVLIFVLFFGCLFHPVAEHYGVPTADYASLPGLTGILNGYQTMDTLAALNFGAVIALNIPGLRYRGRTAGAPQHHPCRLDCRRNAASGLRDADARWRTVRRGMAGRLDWRGHAEQYCQRSVWPGRAGAACRNFRHCMLQYLCRPDCLRRSVFP